jgi:hypothetical protein
MHKPLDHQNPTYKASLFSIVEVISSEDKVERSYLVNYSHHGTKLWLTRVIIWCLTNDKMLTIEEATAEDVATRLLFTPKDEPVSRGPAS